ncbi:MAG: RNA-protein complex protein Nop10 [Candidatus Altiarchaeales archaeon]|nr:MAG: RNA-protein complex protein Nop10 [Candidatus Altiarchaeales archaeon]
MRIHKCPICNSYTLKDICPKCGSKTFEAKPPKFSPDDPYGKYRRMMKREEEKASSSLT